MKKHKKKKLIKHVTIKKNCTMKNILNENMNK